MGEIKNLGKVQFGDVVATAIKEHWSGVLTIDNTDYTEYVEFKGGSIAGFSSAERKKLIGEILTAGGHLSEEEVKRAVDHQKKNGGRLGDILVEMEMITRQRLEEAMALHQMSVLAQCLSAKDSDLTFEPDITLESKK